MFPTYCSGGHGNTALHESLPALAPLRRSTRPKEVAMLFVTLANVRAGTDRERIARRMQWSYPPGLKLIAEYWLQTDNPKLISIAEADDFASISAATSQWDDVFSFTVVPACTAEQGLEMAKQMMK